MGFFNDTDFGGDRHKIETANVAYDMAWGAIKGMIQRGTVEHDDGMRAALGVAIEGAFTPQASDDVIAMVALSAMGYRPIIGVLGEIEATAQ